MLLKHTSEPFFSLFLVKSLGHPGARLSAQAKRSEARPERLPIGLDGWVDSGVAQALPWAQALRGPSTRLVQLRSSSSQTKILIWFDWTRNLLQKSTHKCLNADTRECPNAKFLSPTAFLMTTKFLPAANNDSSEGKFSSSLLPLPRSP